MNRSLQSIRIDDIPLIYALLGMLEIESAIDAQIKTHGNWEGPSPGKLTCLWICYILSCCDHRLSALEPWAEQRLPLLQALIGDSTLSSKDFADDKLGLLLDYLSKEEDWRAIEQQVNQTGIGLYRLEAPDSLPTFRLDSAPMQSHGQVSPGGLLQYGYSKHHNGNLGQFKVQLCSLDNAVNHFAYPISHITVSGEQADDKLYLPLLEEVRAQLSNQSGYERGNLYVGDGKMGSKEIRATISNYEDYYLVPLSKKQLSDILRLEYIDKQDREAYEIVSKVVNAGQTNEEEQIVARGFEQSIDHSYELEGQVHKWTERLLFVQSDYYAGVQEEQLAKCLEQTTERLERLTERKQGKKVLKKLSEVKEASDNILKESNLEDLLEVNIEQKEHIRVVRGYGGKPGRTERSVVFELGVNRQEAAIEARKKLLGWQVYATNAPSESLSFEQCVWKYRYQSNIERQFDNIRNKVVKLLPVYLQKDNRIIGLVNVLMLALKACCLAEYKVSKALQEEGEALGDIYEGNPKRRTQRPSAKRLFKAFDGVSVALVFTDKVLDFALMTKLEPVQKKILHLLNLEEALYNDLKRKMQMFFSNSVLTET